MAQDISCGEQNLGESRSLSRLAAIRPSEFAAMISAISSHTIGMETAWLAPR
jgi:hypothetical protein